MLLLTSLNFRPSEANACNYSRFASSLPQGDTFDNMPAGASLIGLLNLEIQHRSGANDDSMNLEG